eukprot:CAMPEP_0184302884 /NCGR_PEP_ID=MMETSP1049-20130417/12750_1 /TAXON_ID=77928 /ORGANISM="Proteomonas sulcata, Strain CCMP704" /LENGTH=177 /DNA_ID=CAMNT_0026614279 /DNA_START=147 /DNA_END=680 /DNA_ORIENTATION=+
MDLEAVAEAAMRLYVLEDPRAIADPAALKQRLLAMDPSVQPEALEEQLTICRARLEEAAAAGYNSAQLEGVLKGEESGDPALSEAILVVWRRNESKVQEVVRSKSFWGNKLQRMSWRVDVTSQSRRVEEINQPCAIVEVQIGSQASNPEFVRFEMEKEMLSQMHEEVQKLQSLISQS